MPADRNQPKRPNRSKRGGAPRSRRGPQPISLASLERAALAHLERYDSSAENLRAVLARRVRRAALRSGEDATPPEAAAAWIDEVVAKLVGLGLVDDRRFAEGLIRGLRRRGTSRRALWQKLRLKGVPEGLARELLAPQNGMTAEESEQTELAAASLYARRKRLGPYRPGADERATRRERDLGSLARAGFAFEVARAVVDADTPEQLPALPSRSPFEG